MPPFFLFSRHFLDDRGQVHFAEVPDLLRVLGLIVQQDLLQHGLLHRVFSSISNHTSVYTANQGFLLAANHQKLPQHFQIAGA